jgi:hypothetical protein
LAFIDIVGNPYYIVGNPYGNIDATNAMGDPYMGLGTVKNVCVVFVSKLTQILLQHSNAAVVRRISPLNQFM